MNTDDIPTAAALRDESRTVIDRLTVERDALRAALERLVALHDDEVFICGVDDNKRVLLALRAAKRLLEGTK